MSPRRHWGAWFFLVFLFIFIVGSFWAWRWVTSPPPEGREAIFVIQKGESLDSISQRLWENDLIRFPFVFKIFLTQKGQAQKVQAGDFRLRQGMSLEEILEKVTHSTSDVWVTFPEGWRSEQIGAALIAAGFDFDLPSWRQAVASVGGEGYLFPDTYSLPQDASPVKITQVLKANFDRKTEAVIKKAASRGLDGQKLLILASLVEREAKRLEDRPLVAGILVKRLEADWPLQIDATVQYFIGSQNCSSLTEDCRWWPSGLTKDQLASDSPYNTYRQTGLPPGPICNPGLAALQGVAEYQESDYWFYLTGKDGQMRYATTLEEHHQNIADFLN